MKGKNILITGGLGAVGSSLSRAALVQGIASLMIIDDESSCISEVSRDILDDKRVTYLKGSIMDDALLKKALLDVRQDFVFHLAANFANQNSIDFPVKDTEVNSVGTVKMLEYSKKGNVGKFIFSSSSCVYGSGRDFSVDTKDFHLDTPYAINKLHGEYLVEFYNSYHGLPTTTLRYFNSFGPGELPGAYRNVVPNFFALAMQGKPLPITGDRETSRDFNYVENTVTATILAALSDVSNGKTYNVGSGKETTIVSLAEAINKITGNTAPIEFKPVRKWDSINHRCADISVTQKELGYAPVIDLEAQLQKTYEWLKTHEAHFPKN